MMGSGHRWIDLHTHLDGLDIPAQEAVSEATLAGVDRMISVATGPHDLDVVYDIAAKNQPNVYCLLGVHPHEAKHWSQEIREKIRTLAQSPCCVGIGETGLDYYYKHSSQSEQRQAFESQMALAEELNLPVQIHTRDADDDTLAVLKNFKGRVSGVFHCFSGNDRLADEGLALGYDLSFSGIFTFKNAENLRQIAKRVPLDRLHVETDAPFLTPVPLRGKKNRPAFVIHSARLLAQLRGLSEEQMAEQLQKNARRRFPKLN